MGLISNIRKQGGLMVVLIGLGVTGFLVMDVVQNRDMMNSAGHLGKVNGTSFDFNEMRRMEEVLYQGSDADEYSKREYIWNYFVESNVINGAAEKSGLAVGKEELLDLQFGNNLSSIIRQRYSNPNTGAVDMAQLQQVKSGIQNNTLPPNIIPFWSIQEREIIAERLEQKLTSLFAKAVYTPSWQAEMAVKDQVEPIDALVVKVPATMVSDSEVSLTDADYQRYIDENRALYTNAEESRILTFAAFTVLPSLMDTSNAVKAMEDKKEAFQTATSDSLFVIANSGTISNSYVKVDGLPEILKSQVINMNIGDTYGPFVENGEVKLVKLVGRASVPDSVKSRHILVSASNPDELAVADKKIDSLRTLIESGQAKFADLAKAHSTDRMSAEKGGDLGYAGPGMMVQPFNDALFLDSRPGQIKKVTTQFGVHLIEIQDKKSIGNPTGYKLATISSELVPSEETQNKILAQAETIVNSAENLAQLEAQVAATPGLTLQPAFPVKASDATIAGFPPSQGCRDAVKWAFDSKTKVGSISKTIYPLQERNKYYVQNYIVVGLKAIKKKGVSNVDALKDEIHSMVLNAKKVDVLAEKAKGISNMETLAQQFSTTIDTTKSVVFGAAFTQGIGNEPSVVANIYTTDLNKESGIIKGKTGLYMVKPIARTANENKPELESSKRFYTNNTRTQTQGRLLQALIKKADIEDVRASIY